MSMKEFIDTNLISEEIKRLNELRQELKKKNATLRTRVARLTKIIESINQGELFDEDHV